MDSKKRQIIKSRLDSLVSSVTDFDALVDWSSESGLFPSPMADDFKISTKSEHERKTNYFLAVTKRGPAAFDRLTACLKRSQNFDTLDVLNAESWDAVSIDSKKIDSYKSTFCEQTLNSPIDKVQVTKAIDFYGGSGEIDKVYKMNSTPRGLALVFVNKDFDNDVDYPTRIGADKDLSLICDLFSELGYKIFKHFNTTREEMKDIVEKFSRNPELEFVDSLVVAVSSHGERDVIVCKDCNYFYVEEELVKSFHNENCSYLRTKPKMFFIQACRGDEQDGGVALDRADSKSYSPSREMRLKRRMYMPTLTDVVIYYATQSGNVAYLNDVHGSWFFNTITRVFMENAWRCDLQEMMNDVSKRLNRLRADVGGDKQSMEKREQGWESKLYFNPGL